MRSGMKECAYAARLARYAGLALDWASVSGLTGGLRCCWTDIGPVHCLAIVQPHTTAHYHRMTLPALRACSRLGASHSRSSTSSNPHWQRPGMAMTRVALALAALCCLLSVHLASAGPARQPRAAGVAAAVPLSPSAVRYNDSWASLDSRPLPEWFDDAKFGIFIHWGVYSVPSWSPVGEYAEWYWDRLRNQDDNEVTAAFHNGTPHTRKQQRHDPRSSPNPPPTNSPALLAPPLRLCAATYGPSFRYQDFAPMFKAELFNATAWADLFRRSGARYTVPTSKHHEGFTMWPSAQSWNWNAVDIGPHRDLLAEIMDATRAAGLHAGMYFSLYESNNSTHTCPCPASSVVAVFHGFQPYRRPPAVFLVDRLLLSVCFRCLQVVSSLHSDEPHQVRGGGDAAAVARPHHQLPARSQQLRPQPSATPHQPHV